MNDKNRQNIGRNCAYIAAFVALTIAAQLCLSFVPGVEVVTVLFVTFSFAFGCRRGIVAATVFSLLRQLVFGFSPTVLVLYLVYYNLLALLFGFLGRQSKITPLKLVCLTVLACLCTICFTMMDNIITPLWYGYSKRALKIYFYASFSFMIPQVICTAVSVGVLFLPLVKIFNVLKNRH
ncbi:MAG: hypothetical protein IKA57_06245 [Clostridia bacterium]|nr:hypothetical protein [Clostridia bacterium]